MIVISIDYGDSRTGIAVSDKYEIIASPVTVIHEKDKNVLAERILALIKEKEAELIVLGYPKNMDGSEGFKAQAVAEFADVLKERVNLPIELWDERLTTVSAHKVLNDNNVRGKKRKNTVDAVAAVIILQSYLEFRKNKM